MRKQLKVLPFAILTLFFLSGCGGGSSKNSNDSNKKNISAKNTKNGSIAAVKCILEQEQRGIAWNVIEAKPNGEGSDNSELIKIPFERSTLPEIYGTDGGTVSMILCHQVSIKEKKGAHHMIDLVLKRVKKEFSGVNCAEIPENGTYSTWTRGSTETANLGVNYTVPAERKRSSRHVVFIYGKASGNDAHTPSNLNESCEREAKSLTEFYKSR